MKDRVLKNWVTTLIGLLLVLFAMLGYWFKKVELDTFFVLLTIGGTAMGLKDTVFKGRP